MTETEKKTALVAMSGGVDSSVAAKLMTDQGYDCIGCTMKLYDNEDACMTSSRTCCSLDDIEDARSVARMLGMPYYVFNFREDFREKIIEKFIRSYEEGITPNPCIDCNRYMKFEKLHKRGMELGCDRIVTGHYARIEEQDGRYVLKKAVDPGKDQSYVLYDLTQEQLAHTAFPLGGMTKEETRRIAEESGLVNARKHDSQDICFVPDGDYASVIEHFRGRKSEPGDFTDLQGNILGRHKGIIHYTLGQRKGLGLALKEPMYVCRIDPVGNRVVLGRNEDLFSDTLEVKDVNWISGQIPETEIRCSVKVRYRHAEQSAVIIPLEPGRVRVVFDAPQRAVTPGQSAVFYDGDVVLGGGIIEKKYCE